MYDVIKIKHIGSNRVFVELVGESKDVKPIETIQGNQIANGSTYYESDTQKVFMYISSNKTWKDQLEES